MKFIHLIPWFGFLLLLSCAGYPHDVTENRKLEEPFGFCHAGTRGDPEKEFLNSMGADWVRIDFAWSRMQKQPGEFDFSGYDELLEKTDRNGVKVLAIIDYDVPWIHENPEGKRQIDSEDLPYWLDYVEAVANRYGDRVGGFEIWNEANFNLFWTGSDDDFFELTSRTASLLKEVAPDTPIIVGSILYNPFLGGYSYLKKLVKSGAVDNADAVALHPYGTSPTAAAQRISKAIKLLERNQLDAEIWITEIGFPTGGSYPHAVPEERQGVYVTKSLAAFYSAGASKIMWYSAYDPYMPEDVPEGASSESFFGIAYPDSSLKSGGNALAFLTPGIRDARWAPELLDDKHYAGAPTAIYPFVSEEGTVTVVLWSRFGRTEARLNGFEEGSAVYDTGTSTEWVWSAEDLIPINPEPVIIRGIPTGKIGLERP